MKNARSVTGVWREFMLPNLHELALLLIAAPLVSEAQAAINVPRIVRGCCFPRRRRLGPDNFAEPIRVGAYPR
jgi:hypothetical protein